MIKGKKVILGICGGIAIYKVCELIRSLMREGADVICILTESAKRFISPLTFKALSRNEVYDDMFKEYRFSPVHIPLAEAAEIFVVIPATADTIAKLATGRAEDLLSATVLSTTSPVLICPAMNERMWNHPITQQNVEKLKKIGYQFIGPEEGELVDGKRGVGRLASIEKIIEKIREIIN